MHRGPGNPRDMDESEAIRKRAREEPTLARSIQYAAQYGLHLESVSHLFSLLVTQDVDGTPKSWFYSRSTRALE